MRKRLLVLVVAVVILFAVPISGICANEPERFYGVWEGEMDGYKARLSLSPSEKYLIPDLSMEELALPCMVTEDAGQFYLQMYLIDPDNPLVYSMSLSDNSENILILANRHRFYRVAAYGEVSMTTDDAPAFDAKEPYVGKWFGLSDGQTLQVMLLENGELSIRIKENNFVYDFAGRYSFKEGTVVIDELEALLPSGHSQEMLAELKQLRCSVYGHLLVTGDRVLYRVYEPTEDMEECFGWHLLDDGTAEITAWYGRGPEIVIPSIIEGKDVTSVAPYAFVYCNAAKISFPETIRKVGSYALFSCDKLEELVFAEGLETLSNDAICSLPSLKKLNLPQSLEVNSEDHPFSWLGDEVVVTVTEGSSAYKWVMQNNDSLFAEVQTITPAQASFELQFSLLENGTYAVSGYTGTGEHVEVPEQVEGISVTAVADDAFRFCRMNTISLPQTIDTLGVSAFADCVNLTQLSIPEGVKVIPRKLLAGCTSLERVDVPLSVEKISDNCFPAQYSLVIYGYRDTALEDWAEMMAVDEVVTVNVSLQPHPQENGCYRDSGFLFVFNEDDKACIMGYDWGDTQGGYLILDIFSVLNYDDQYSSVEEIGEKAFFGIENLTKISFPQTIKKIGVSSFEGCKMLPELKLPNFLVSIEDRAFFGCVSLEEVTIPDKVTTIGAEAFGECSSLKSVHLGENVTFIGENAFPSDTTVYAPDGSYAQSWAAERGYTIGQQEAIEVTLKKYWKTREDFDRGEYFTLSLFEDGTFSYDRYDLMNFGSRTIYSGTWHTEGLNLILVDASGTYTIQLDNSEPSSIVFNHDLFY